MESEEGIIQGSEEYTEPITDSGFTESCNGSQDQESQSQSQKSYWGRLYPLKTCLPVIDLVQRTLTVGKGDDADIVITKNELPREVFKKCSKLHFEVLRRQVNNFGSSVPEVIIIDRSSNGTFINDRLLRKSKKSGSCKLRVLNSNDVVGFPSGSPAPYNAYLFIDAIVSPSTTVPRSVKKKYDVTLRLGLGAFGEVSLVFEKEKGIPYAMKTIVKDLNAKGKVVDAHKEKLLNELTILQAVKHPNIIKLVDFLDFKKEHFLFLEFMEGMDLSKRIEKNEQFDEALAKFYMFQIANGVKYLHRMGITHRDLKPANLLLFSSDRETLLKITDFGLSKVLSNATMMKTLCGTKLYVAPEVLFGGGAFKYTEQVDVWSMGVIMYLCLSGMEPFTSSSESSVADLIKEAAFTMPFELWHSVSATAKSLTKRMLTKEPEERIKSSEILDDPWFQDQHLWEKLKNLYEDMENFTPPLCDMVTSSMDSTDHDESSIYSHSLSQPVKRFRPN